MQEQDRPQPGSGEPSGEPAADPTPPPATTSSPPPPPPAAMPPPSASESAPPTATGRPTGITILAVLAAIGGFFLILGGLGLAGLGGLATAGGAAAGGAVAFLGILLLALGVAQIVLAYGFWTLRPWAWTLGVGLQGVSVILVIAQLFTNSTTVVGAIISIAISAVILYYLFRPEIQAAFGRS